MKSFLIGLVVLLSFAAPAVAQLFPYPTTTSNGEAGGQTLKCFFECKPGPVVQGVATFQEITTIMLANQSPSDRDARVYFFNGRERCLGHMDLKLSPVDLDEINVCHTMLGSMVIPPPAGLVEIVVTDPTTAGPGDGVYAWGKNVLGKFRYDVPEPFQGRVTGVGKYECRVVPQQVNAQQAINNKCGPPATPLPLFPVLVEETNDPCCNGDANNDGYVFADDFTQVTQCVGQPPSGACASSDVQCDGLINAIDQGVVQCQINSGLPDPDPACCP